MEADVTGAQPGSVEAQPEAPAPKKGKKDKEKAAAQNEAMRQAIAKLIAKAKREIPHYYLGHQVDMSRSLAWLEEQSAQLPVTERMLPAVLLLKAAALATRAVPEMNGFWRNDQFEQSEAVHLGVPFPCEVGDSLHRPSTTPTTKRCRS